jgi:hypothetical protein
MRMLRLNKRHENLKLAIRAATNISELLRARAPQDSPLMGYRLESRDLHDLLGFRKFLHF